MNEQNALKAGKTSVMDKSGSGCSSKLHMKEPIQSIDALTREG